MEKLSSQAYNNILYKCNKNEKYYRDIITFDIESTSFSKDIAFMYIFAVNINGNTYYGRTWNEFKIFVDTLNKLASGKKFIIWVHNLSFEFQFMQALFKWNKVFSTSPHKVVYAQTENVMFRCSYFMSNLPLYKLQSTYSLKTKKLIGDLDYTKTYHFDSDLTEKEMQYVENDVVLLYEYIEYMLKECGGFSANKMPYTLTGFSRKYMREKTTESNEYYIMRSIVKESSPTDLILYNMFRRAFAGGYAHCNWIWCGEFILDLTSLDKKSFYPAIMCKEKFPRKFIKMKSEKYMKLIKNPEYAVIADICFFNLKAKTNHSIISKHKCSYIANENYIYNKGKEKGKYKTPIFDNGRVRYAEKLVITITELDFDTIQKYYSYDSIKVGRVYASRKRYLPKSFIETVLDLYSDKTTLRDVEGMEIEYQNKKARLNSLYGMCVTDILQQIIEYNQNDRTWVNLPLQGDELVKYKENYKSILLYQTGVYITAYCRHELLEHNLHVGDDVVYNDTDSIKLVNYEKHKKYFDEYDEKVKQQLYKMCEYYNIDKSKLEPMDVYGNRHFLGTLSNEGTYTKFKTLGSKRYIYEIDGKLHATVAGCPKKSMENYLLSTGKPFENFNRQLVIPENMTNKNTHFYTEPSEPIKVVDSNGKEAIQEVTYGISLLPQKFDMTLSGEYANFLLYSIDNGLSHQERFTNVKEMTKVNTLWEDLKWE